MYSARHLINLFHTTMIPLVVALFITGAFFGDYSIILWSVVALFLLNVLYACFDIRNRLLFLFLHAGIALFWLTWPTIGFFDEKRTWLLSTPASTDFAFWAIFLTLFFLYCGSSVYEMILASNDEVRTRKIKSIPVKIDIGIAKNAHMKSTGNLGSNERFVYIRKAALGCFLVCLCGSIYLGYQKLSYMQGLGLRYEDYYLLSSDVYSSSFITTLDAMLPYMLCAFLAAMPRKGLATTCMFLYVLGTVPMLMIGSRGDIVVSFLFMGLYYIFRQVTDRDQVWIGKKEKILVLVGVPIGIFVMGLWNYVRADSVVRPDGFFAQIVDALYRQGVSFSVLGKGFDVNSQIQSLGFKFFTMGDFINSVTQGFIGQSFLGCENLGSVNSPQLALHGNLYAHTMSYFAHSGYLGGEGWGSSYLLELYADFGYGWIVIFSFLFGMILVFLSRSIGKSWFWGTAALISSMSIFHMPRGYAMEWISFLWTTRFWLAMALLAIATTFVIYCSSDKIKCLRRYRAKVQRSSPAIFSRVSSRCSSKNEDNCKIV